MPGAWPAQVLMPTTSGRLSVALEPNAAVVTPVEPTSRPGSPGAFFRASKSSDDTDSGAASDFSAPAHLRMSLPL
jgi:hypothetical protein